MIKLCLLLLFGFVFGCAPKKDDFSGRWSNPENNFDNFVVEKVEGERYKLTLNGKDAGFGFEQEGKLHFSLWTDNMNLTPKGRDTLMLRGKNQFRFDLGRLKNQ